jgi:hypothetical protein
LSSEAIEFGAIPLEKCGTLEKVEGQITAEAELGEHCQITAALLGLTSEFQDPRCVTGKITNGWIQLRESDFHVALVEYGHRRGNSTWKLNYRVAPESSWL